MEKAPCFRSIFGFLFLFILASCNGQVEAPPPSQEKANQPQAKVNLAEYDAYFTESRAINLPNGPGSITRNIIQDKKGNIWFATFEGIIRYDGTSFTNLTNEKGLRRFRAFAVLEDSKGELWFGTIGAGVYRYDGQSFTNYTTKDGLFNDRVGCVYEDQAGNIWFGAEGGISMLDRKSLETGLVRFQNFTTEEGITHNEVNTIIEDNTGQFWIGTRGNAYIYDGKTFTALTNNVGSPFVNVRSIIKDKKGNIWLGGNNGLWRYDGAFYSNFTSDFVGYIYEDRKGNIWTSSETTSRQTWALSRYNAETLSNGETTSTQVNAETGMYFGILEDDAGNIWVGSLQGVCRYDGKTFKCLNEKEAQNQN